MIPQDGGGEGYVVGNRPVVFYHRTEILLWIVTQVYKEILVSRVWGQEVMGIVGCWGIWSGWSWAGIWSRVWRWDEGWSGFRPENYRGRVFKIHVDVFVLLMEGAKDIV